jgi:uncharacterized protein (TIGR03663 family)
MEPRNTRNIRASILRISWFLLVLLLAAILRFPQLSSRPMHCDEAINADKSGTLVEQGRYEYDPKGFHGPTLHYLTLLPAWIRGEVRYRDLDESTLRSVPAVLGILLVAATFLLVPVLGYKAASMAAFLAAISPAMVYYSRYYIHETPFVFFSFIALIAICRYRKNPGCGWAMTAGLSLGLMYATKETSVIVMMSLAAALLLSGLVERWCGRAPSFWRIRLPWMHLALGALTACAVAILLYSSFFSNPRGILDSVRAFRAYFDLAGAVSVHTHAWYYYLALLSFFKLAGGPFWTEGWIIALALIGLMAASSRNAGNGPERAAIVFFGIYTLLMIAAYSWIPYKTPWCLLGFLHGLILLAGVGVNHLQQMIQKRLVRGIVLVLLTGAMTHLGWQAWAASFSYSSDPRNPYVYAHTGKDVFAIAGQVEGLSRAHAQGASMPIQIISRENLWPLPWYFRGLPGVRWSTSVLDHIPNAPVILVTPDMESGLARKLYELPPPGERELYMNIFEHPVELRPGVELRGYAAKTLWDEYLQAEAKSREVPPSSRR